MEAFVTYIVERLLFFPFLIGFIFTITALITLKFPPKNINYVYGYRTPASMKNQQTWDFSQRYSGIKMFQIGLFLMTISFINLFLNLTQGLQLIVGLSLAVLSCGYLFFTTERAIKKKFQKNKSCL